MEKKNVHVDTKAASFFLFENEEVFFDLDIVGR